MQVEFRVSTLARIKGHVSLIWLRIAQCFSIITINSIMTYLGRYLDIDSQIICRDIVDFTQSRRNFAIIHNNNDVSLSVEKQEVE